MVNQCGLVKNFCGTSFKQAKDVNPEDSKVYSKLMQVYQHTNPNGVALIGLLYYKHSFPFRMKESMQCEYCSAY